MCRRMTLGFCAKFHPDTRLPKKQPSHFRGSPHFSHLRGRQVRPAMFLKRILYYLNPATLFTPSDGDRKMRFMNGVNRFSIFVFLICLVVMIVRALRH